VVCVRSHLHGHVVWQARARALVVRVLLREEAHAERVPRPRGQAEHLEHHSDLCRVAASPQRLSSGVTIGRTAMKTLRIGLVGFRVGDRSRGRFATPADFPQHD
jgi:hypothetical protein